MFGRAMKMKSRVRRAFGLLASAAIVLLSQQPTFAADKISVALNWVPGGDHAAMYYAKQLGWYKDANLDVDLEAGKGSVGVLQKGSNPLSPLRLPAIAHPLPPPAHH